MLREIKGSMFCTVFQTKVNLADPRKCFLTMEKQVAPKVLQVTFRPYGVTVEKQDKSAYIVTVC